MELVIEIIKGQGSLYFSLTDLDHSEPTSTLIKSSDLSEVRASLWYHPLKETDKKLVLDKCTNNQLITAIYFYLDNNPASELLMTQWFADTGCSKTMASLLANIVFNARILRMEDDIDLTTHSLFQNNDKSHCFNGSEILPIESLNMTGILQQLKSGKFIQWRFDSVSSVCTSKYNIIDISGLIESASVVEDHHCIITGFSAKYITCIDMLASNNTLLMANLCDHVSLGLRDKMSIGTALIKLPAILEIILESGYKGIEFFGLDSDGKIKLYSEQVKRSKIQFSEPYGSEMLMPLFIKFHK